MGKYYAVKNGRKTGIFNTWAECEKMVKGFKGAKYKSFTTLVEAEEFLVDSEIKNKSILNTPTYIDELCIYVDGSYSKNNFSAGYGCVMVKNEEIIHTITNRISIDENENLWNVTGEISGTLAGLEWAINNNYKEVNILYDYEGIENWANGSWSAKKELTKHYVKMIKEYLTLINITFIKVKAHSGDQYNDLADKLAKEATYLQNENSVNSKIESPENKIILTQKLYESIISSPNTEKITIIINKYHFNDGILKKIAKYFWKDDGYKIKDLKDIQATLDTNSSTLKILYFTVENKEINKILSLEGS